MSAFERIIDDINTADLAFVETGLKPILDLNKNIANYISKLNDLVKEYQSSGVVPSTAAIENWETVPEDIPKPLENTDERTSIKENIEPAPVKEEHGTSRTRPKRNAFKEATQNISHQSSLSTNAKLRRPTTVQDNFQNIYVKVEKLSICNSEPADATDAPADVQVKSELMETMPAPSRPAPRRKKKDSKAQLKQEKIEEEKQRCSDVIIENAVVPTINLVESSDEGDSTMKNESTRTTRTKTAKKKMKRSRTHSSEDERKREKRSKSNEEEDKTVVDEAPFEDALSTMEDNQNATFVAKPAEQNLNATVVVENPKMVTNLVPKSVADMMTDDESEEEVPKKPVKPVRAIPKPTKQVFSPFEQSPVKKKVQAFEKLKEEVNSLPPRVTRTKTKAKEKKDQEAAAAATEPDRGPPSNVKEKAKIFTPQTSKFLPKASSTTVKQGRVAPSSSNESLSSTKSVSALKASQAEYREREKKRREKEEDALKKREALIQAQIEEKKRKREEKQLKAQQQREVLEKEKLKIVEAQRMKDERHRQLVAEQEEKKQKQKEEVEKKRMLAKMRAIEEKKREEGKRGEEKKVQAAQDHRPEYMKYKAPLLPTDDCYDSDDENYRQDKIRLPDWTKDSNIRFMQRCASAAGEAVKNTFFSIQAQTPDLQDIFEVIKPEKLKRTSSATWHRPPRFTMVPVLAGHDETAEFEDE